MKRFTVVIPKDDGGVEIHPMKEWLRQHPEHIPTGLDATDSTSHQLRGGLRKGGWHITETDAEVRFFLPGSNPANDTVDILLGIASNGEEDDFLERTSPSFGLEFQLRDFLANNLNTISVNGEILSLYVDPTGRDGVEYPTSVGNIDILAKDKKGNFYVFELKRVGNSDRAVGQLARYMGWIKNTIGKETGVNGVIVASRVDEKLRYAASIIPNVNLFEYEIEFHLNNANEIE